MDKFFIMASDILPEETQEERVHRIIEQSQRYEAIKVAYHVMILHSPGVLTLNANMGHHGLMWGGYGDCRHSAFWTPTKPMYTSQLMHIANTPAEAFTDTVASMIDRDNTFVTHADGVDVSGPLYGRLEIR